MSALPELGIVAYYRALEDIPGVMAAGAMYALVGSAKDKYLLITAKSQKNVTTAAAQEFATMGNFVKKEVVSERKKKQARKPGLLETLLFEAESAIAPSETDPVQTPDVSLDQKVDRYLVRYEKDAIPTSDDYAVDNAVQARVNASNNPQGVAMGNGQPVGESKKPKKGLLESILFEAPGDPGEEDPLADPAAAAAPAPGGDLGGDPAAMGMEPAAAGAAPPAAPPAPAVIDTPKMNMNNYTRAVARLINNYEALMDPKTTILNRAKEYVRVNYDEATATMFEQTMRDQYGITETPAERDQRDAPGAAGAIYGAPGGGV